jgi:hypothetical protein
MKAMDIRQEGDELIIKIDVSEAAIKAAPPSSSGKTRLLASTNGFVRVGPGSLGLNFIVPNSDRA